jgi:hypothetical protein
MPLPEKHLSRLEADLSARERWLQTLQLQITALQEEASAHETILALGRDPEIIQLLHELHDSPELRNRIAQDTRSFFEARGIRILDGENVTLTDGPKDLSIEARFITPTLRYGVGWSRRSGFYLVRWEEEVFYARDHLGNIDA